MNVGLQRWARAAAIGLVAGGMLSAYLATHRIGYVAYYVGPEQSPRIAQWNAADTWRWIVVGAATPLLVGLAASPWYPAAVGVWLVECGTVLWIWPPDAELSFIDVLLLLAVVDVSLAGIGALLARCVRSVRRRAQKNR